MMSVPRDIFKEHLLLKNIRYELFPTASQASKAASSLPRKSLVTVSCSPKHGIEFGLSTCEYLLSKGHHVIPHISARLIRDKTHLVEIASWIRRYSIDDIFVVGGDAGSSLAYEDTSSFLNDFLMLVPSMRRVGFAVYPEGNSQMSLTNEELLEIALRKQSILQNYNVAGYAVSQICFNSSDCLKWIGYARSAGFHLPLYIGLPGVIERAKLVDICLRLGISSGLKTLKCNPKIFFSFMPGFFDPSDQISKVAPHSSKLKIEGIHCFTFNSTNSTVKWVESMTDNHKL